MPGTRLQKNRSNLRSNLQQSGNAEGEEYGATVGVAFPFAARILHESPSETHRLHGDTAGLEIISKSNYQPRCAPRGVEDIPPLFFSSFSRKHSTAAKSAYETLCRGSARRY